MWSVTSGQQQGEPLHVNGPVTSLCFTNSGEALLVGAERDPEVSCYDTKTHNSLYVSLPHPIGVSHITSNADGSLVVTVTTDGAVRLWRIPTATTPPPKWLGDYLRALGGLSFSAEQQLTQVPTRARLELRKALLARPRDSSVWDKVMSWSFQRIDTGAVDPWARASK